MKRTDVEKIRQQFGFYQANEDRIAGEIARYEGELEEVKKSLTDGVADAAGKKKASKAAGDHRILQNDAVGYAG